TPQKLISCATTHCFDRAMRRSHMKCAPVINAMRAPARTARPLQGLARAADEKTGAPAERRFDARQNATTESELVPQGQLHRPALNQVARTIGVVVNRQ